MHCLGTVCTVVHFLHCAKASGQGDRGNGAEIQATLSTKPHNFVYVSSFNSYNKSRREDFSLILQLKTGWKSRVLGMTAQG
jgi:hypothetical protein